MAMTDFDFVLFGGGGDLAMRKLIPALYALSRGKGFLSLDATDAAPINR
jgi:glucose-6-phosphate 1-dehydrogenase